MKANELRIGNLLNDLFGGVVEVRGVTHKGIWIRSNSGPGAIQNFNPIPITEDWLLKFGFKRTYGDVFVKGIYDLEPLCKDSEDWGFHINENEIQTVIKYLHQLQNLYFSLSGKELRIKSSAIESVKRNKK